jgi:hypothetical protein
MSQINEHHEHIIPLYTPPSSFPSVWNVDERLALPPRFALWFPEKKDYVILDVNRERYPAIILTNPQLSRTNPFHFATTEPDTTVRMVTIRKPRARVNSEFHVAVWFTGGWLCRSNDIARLKPLVPILGFSNTACVPYRPSIGIYATYIYQQWEAIQTSEDYREFVRSALPRLSQPTKPKFSLPSFVSNALIKTSLSNGDHCPISFEPLETGTTAITPCFHMFNQEALTTWLRTSTECPVCKQECTTVCYA